MRFNEFWPLYLRAHRLPGTRALHYFATAIGIISAVEAVATGRPLIFVVGIAVSYAIAILAHWFVEHNQPLIRVNAFWGAVADIRMCWLALCGRMGHELARHGVTRPTLARSPSEVASSADAPVGRGVFQALQVSRFGGQPARLILLATSTAGLTAGLVDLSDLGEPMEGFAFPILQLTMPIAAFAGALIAALAVMVVAQRLAHAKDNSELIRENQMNRSAEFHSDEAGIAAPDATGASEASLRRACIVLLSFGTIAFGVAEFAEHGLPNPGHFYGMLAGLAALLCIGVPVVWHLVSDEVQSRGKAGPIEESLDGASWSGPATRGLRVDGRVQLVDILEDLLSFGRRRAILEAALIAAALKPGDRLADVGCGTGELALVAAHALAHGEKWMAVDVVGIDATPGMIEVARQRARGLRNAARFEVGVAEALPLPDEYADAVTSTFFFHHLPTETKRQAIHEMWRVLAPGGRLVIADYGWARSIKGLIASFPMRFNFHEYVRPQLNGELERIIASEGLGSPENVSEFLGYIRILRITKPTAPTSSP